jgi:hypothetical protein
LLPLTGFAACPGSLIGVSVAVCRAALGREGAVTGPVWSGRAGGRAGGGFEQVPPLGFTVPALGQVQRDVAAAVAGDAGGDVDEAGPDGGAAGFGVGEAGQRPGGAQQVVADRGQREPGGVGGEEPGGSLNWSVVC